MKQLRRFFANCITAFVFNKHKAKRIKRIIEQGLVNRFCEVRRVRKMENKDYIKHNLAIVSIMKNEGAYLREWIEFHRLVGVEKFYLYDNESTDDTKNILEPYIKSGVVEYVWYPGQKMQLSAYYDCVSKHKNDTKWLAIIDLDEYVVPTECDSVTEILDKCAKKYAQFIIPWVIFGSGGHIKKPKGLVLESYTKCAKNNWLYKSIVNPRLVISMKCHEHNVAGRTKHFSNKTIRIHHYHCKSWEEYKLKSSRGDAWHGAQAGMERYQEKTFRAHDLNEVVDNTALKFISRIKQQIGI